MNSGGYYSVITDSSSATGFIDIALANGLTYNDNPQGYNGTLFAGLSTSRLLKAGQSSVVIYDARNGENLDWSITTYNISQLNVVATLGGKTVETTTVTSNAFDDDMGDGEFSVNAENGGQLQIKITPGSILNESEGMIVVGVDSNIPFDNCTITIGSLPTIGGGGGLTPAKKAGIAIGVIGLVALIAAGIYFPTKYWHKTHGPKFDPQTPQPPPMEKGPFPTVQVGYPPPITQPPMYPTQPMYPVQPMHSVQPIVPPIPPQSQAPPQNRELEQPNQPDQNPADQNNSNHHHIKVKRIKRRKVKRDILEGKLLTSDGIVIDDTDPENPKPLGRLVSGDIAVLVGKRCAKKGQILDDEDKVIGQCEVLSKEGEDEESSDGEGAADPEKRGSSKKSGKGDTEVEEYESWGKTIAREGVKTGVQETVKTVVRQAGLQDRIEDVVNAVL